MTEPITIEEIELQGFRAFRKPQSVLLHEKRKKSLAIFAPNGAGKSSLVDALEYYVADKATLDRLGKRASGTLAGPEYVRHVSVGKNDIKIHIRFKQGHEEFEGSRTGDPIPNAAKRIRPLIKVPFIIRDYELRNFVQENRYGELVKWFALEPLDKIQKNLQSLEKRIKTMIENKYSDDIPLQHLKTLTNGALSTWDEPTILEWVNREVLAQMNVPITFEELADGDPAFQKLTRQSEMEQNQAGSDHTINLLDVIKNLFVQCTTPQAEPTGLVIDFEKAVLDFENASANASEIKSKTSNYVFRKVWAKSQELLESETDLDKCPVCDTAFVSSPRGSRDAVLNSLRINLGRLSEYKGAEENKKNTEETLHRAANDLKTKLGEFFRWAGSGYQYETVTAYNKALQSWKPGENAPDSKDAADTLAQLHSVVTGDIEVQQGQRAYSKALDTTRRLLEIKADLCRMERIRSNLTIISDGLAQQAGMINHAIMRHIQGSVDRLKDEARAIYKEIQGPDAPIYPIEINLPGEDRRNQRSAHITIDFMNRGKEVPPNSVLSESQNRTLALAIRLAAISMLNTEFKVIALDDVTMSYDDERRQHIAALLQERFSEFQIILATHDFFFYNRLKDRLSPKKWGFKEIKWVIDEYGPKIEDRKTLEMIINEKLANNEIAGNDIRQAQEEWLTCICAGFGTSVTFKPGKRPALYDLAESLHKFLKDKGYNPPRIKGHSGQYLALMMNGELPNIASHYNDYLDMRVSPGDLKVAWRDFLEFKNHFKCSNCGEDGFMREPNQKPKCVSCKTEFAFASDAGSI